MKVKDFLEMFLCTECKHILVINFIEHDHCYKVNDAIEKYGESHISKFDVGTYNYEESMLTIYLI